MKCKNGDRRAKVVDLAAYRAGRKPRRTSIPDESDVVTDIRFSITRAGKVIASRPVLDTTHLLAVLSWCQELASLALDSYIEKSL